MIGKHRASKGWRVKVDDACLFFSAPLFFFLIIPPGLLIYNWHRTFWSLMCTMWWFDIHVYRGMFATISLANIVTSHGCRFFFLVVPHLKWYFDNLNSMNLGQFSRILMRNLGNWYLIGWVLLLTSDLLFSNCWCYSKSGSCLWGSW